MDDLVSRLCTGDHQVEVVGRDIEGAEFVQHIRERGTVIVRFTGTRGGTDLLVTLDPQAVRTGEADNGTGAGRLHIEGTLTLNDVPVRCVTDVSLRTLTGSGRLQRSETG